MSGNRAIRFATIAVWTVAGLVLLTLAFMRATTSPVGLTAAVGARPVVYEFTTDT